MIKTITEETWGVCRNCNGRKQTRVAYTKSDYVVCSACNGEGSQLIGSVKRYEEINDDEIVNIVLTRIKDNVNGFVEKFRDLVRGNTRA